MSRPRLGERFRELNQWYGILKDEERLIVIQNIKQGNKAMMKWLDSNAPEIKKTYELLQGQLHEWGKQITSSQLREKMRGYKLDPTLLEAMAEMADLSLILYRYAAVLRDMEDDDFEKITSLIITDNYIERRFNSYGYCDEYLGLNDVKKTRQCYVVVMKLIDQHYDQLDTLEELGESMENELSFTKKQIEIFLRLLISHREAIDRFMLFEKLKQIDMTVRKMRSQMEI